MRKQPSNSIIYEVLRSKGRLITEIPAELTENPEISKALEEEIPKGISQGERQKSLSIAKNLLNMGMTIHQVTEATGISEEIIKQLTL